MTTTATAVTLDSTSSPLPKFKAPSAETFSFKAPFLPSTSSSAATSVAGSSKQRRVSLALPSSPPVVPASSWSFRDDTGLELEEKKAKLRKVVVEGEDEWQERKLRKKWSPEETQMLVDGCNKHGVGNWKTILSDPTLTFDNRSPVDLKDRFRTYFPDAYKQHYPNARTHLSTKIRSTLPDGSSLFEKTRSKKRRPFTEEEDRALKAGYEKHGTVWATIVKDPIFQEQNRRSTDLRDRFRNAFPELYQAAGYKPRTAVKKKTTSATTPVFTSGPNTPATSPRKLPSRAVTDDQLAMSTTGPVRMQTRRRRRNTSQGIFRGGTKSVPQSNAPSEDEDSSGDEEVAKPTRMTRSASNSHAPSALTWSQKPSSSFSSSPVTSSTAATDDEVDNSGDMMDTSFGEYGYGDTGNVNTGMATMMIGKSAWGTQDWFSSNPRLDSSTPGNNNLDGGGNLSPSSPFSTFNSPPGFSLQTLNSLNSDLFNPMHNHNLSFAGNNDSSEHNGHGVFDRYDLVPPTASNSHNLYSHSHSFSSPSFNPYDNMSFSSDLGLTDDYDSRSALSDEWGGIGGGLMSGSMSMDGGMGSVAPGGRGFTHHSDYAGDLIFSSRTHQPVQPFAHDQHGLGLGLSGMGVMPGTGSGTGIPQNSGIHPLQLHAQTPVLSSLPGIDEFELTGITSDDPSQADSSSGGMDHDVGIMDMSPSPPEAQKETLESQHHHRSQRDTIRRRNHRSQSVMSESRLHKTLTFEDLVHVDLKDLDDEDDVDVRRSFANGGGREENFSYDCPSDDEQHLTPPATPLTKPRHLRGLRKSARAGTVGSYSSSSSHGRSISVPPVDRVGLDSSRPAQVHTNSQPEMMRISPPPLSSPSLSYQSEPDTSMDDSASLQPQSNPASPPAGVGALSTPAAAAQIPLPNPPTFASLFLASQSENQYNLPFLDLHYGMPAMWDSSAEAASRQALDLAQSSRSPPAGNAHNFTLAGRRMMEGGGFGGSTNVKAAVAPPVQAPSLPARSHSLSHTHSMQHLRTSHHPGRAGQQGHHQRGQSTGAANVMGMGSSSSVCPQDLMLTRRNNGGVERSERNKRKRASWDGARQ
ncbi:hypothetical protein BDP27DRAFT_1332894 [Rhodocollybia butyracea]|uniref:Meiotically up-regulated gene 152 protein n=1 Tax=Rhodocollybia butyracea TaxID=206335 RepID=A0A9P5PKF9_9AGAR|nr:hypothetical protein BDP27DRAFT_1332894 [Rhodocollybia butyracea]